MAQGYQDRAYLDQFSEWKNPRYQPAFTAAKQPYLNEEEQNFVLFLNLLRLNPSLFAKTFFVENPKWNEANSLGYSVMMRADVKSTQAYVLSLEPLTEVVVPSKNNCDYSTCRLENSESAFCKSLVMTSSSSGQQFYENSGLRILMGFLSRENTVVAFWEKEQVGHWGLHIGASLQKGKVSSGIYFFSDPVYTKAEYEKMLTEENKQKDSRDFRDFMAMVPAWNAPKYKAANTAQNVNYLKKNEKEVYYFLNLARLNPPLFAETFLKKYVAWNDGYAPDMQDYYVSSLYKTMLKTASMPVLVPDQQLYETAKCHAVYSGKIGYVGHERQGCNENFSGECCAYGSGSGLEIVMQLLIDYDVASLGHREMCLDPRYKSLGVSVEPHKTYRVNCVMDFR